MKAEGDALFSDGFESGDPALWSIVVPPIDLPRGAVAFFDLEECPTGWDDIYGYYVGRAFVGLVPGGQLGGQVGSQSNGQSGTHFHAMEYNAASSSHGHNHEWAYLSSQPNPVWRSFSNTGSPVTQIEWSNGIDGAGSGHYLFAAAPPVIFYTQNAAHSHSVAYSSTTVGYNGEAPNVQFRACKRQ